MGSALLAEHALLAAPPDVELTQVARLAAAVCGVGTATVNLLDPDDDPEPQQHQVATAGFEGGASPRDRSLCDVTARQAAPVLVRDAREDPRFARNDWVTGALGDVRFYAAFQLRDAEQRVIGTLCVFDTAPRVLTAQQQEALGDLAGQAARLLRQRREARSLEQRLQELDRTNAELTAFAGRVAHDLRNPLTGVLGFLRLASRHDAGAAPLLGTCLEQATAAALRLQEMLEGLLLFASAGTPAPAVDVDLDRLAAQVAGDVRHHLDDAQAVLDVGPLGAVRTDPLLLGQVLQNLLGNAVKYRDPERPVRVRLVREDTPGACTLLVQDNGRGIPDAEKAGVFELFGRGPNTGQVAGAGIGLATCQRSVEALGGAIALSDTPGGGLTVTVRLPVA